MKKKIVVLGGGTGSFVVLSGLKDYDISLTAIVNMADDGGSSGILRDELGVLPPGDVRQCLVALSDSSKDMLDLFNYRFRAGRFFGHNFGNIFLTALEKTTGNFSNAVHAAERILAVKGRVIPVTLDDVQLFLRTKKGKLISGESRIDKTNLLKTGIEEIGLSPKGILNPEAKEALIDADLIIIAPGNLYSSLIPNFLVEGVSEVLKNKKNKVLYICNLVNKPGSTDGFTLTNYIQTLEDIVGFKFINYALFNTKKPDSKVLKKYTLEGELLVKRDYKEKFKVFESDLIDPKMAKVKKGDILDRNLIRHHKKKLAAEIMKIVNRYS